MYNPKIWYTGDIVTSGGLNNMEQGIAQNAHDIETINDSIEDLSADATELKSELNGIDAKISDIRTVNSKNLFDWETVKQHVLLNATTGEEEYSALNDSSDFIPIESEKISIRNLNQQGINTLYRVYFYKSNKEFIKRETMTTTETAVFSIPDNAAFIRIVVPTAKASNSKWVIAKGETIIVAYEPHYMAYDKTARATLEKVSSNVGMLMNVIPARIIAPPPMLTIIDDDGHLDYKDYLLPFSLEMNAPIATAVTPLRFGGQSGVGRYMTVDEIKECMNMGAEVLCHTYTHVPKNEEIRKTKVVDGHLDGNTFIDSDGNTVTPSSTCVYHDTTTDYYYTNENGTGYWHITNITVPDISKLISVYTDVGGYYDSNGNPCYTDVEDYYSEKLAKYYTKAKNILLQYGFKDADILVYNNDTGDDPMALKAARGVFRCGFDINGSKLNKYGLIDRTQVHRYSIENAVNQYYGVSRMKSLIDSALSNGGWMVWTMHTTGNEWRGTTTGTHTGIGRETVLNNLREAINYAHTRGLQIVTARYACSAYIDGVY